MGIVSCVGSQIKDVWQNILEGNSGISSLNTFDTSQFSTRIGGLVKDFDVLEILTSTEARKMDPFIHYGIGASSKALSDSGLEISEGNNHRIGVAMGAGIGGLLTIEQNHQKMIDNGPRRISPFFVPGSIINMISGHVSIIHKITGPNLAIVSACSTSTHCIGIAARTVAHGDADVMLAGGAEHATTPLAVGGFCAARAMSTKNNEPTAASRPFDKDRDGFVLSDGAGCLILEEYEHAKRRGAKLYAELIGFGMSADAHHVTLSPNDGEGARKCMVSAMNDAGIAPSEIDYLNAHGTSTPAGDIGETVGIKRAFGDASKELAISSTKSTTGHLLGAAGAAEAIFSILAISNQVLPPTINYETPDPACDLDYVPNTARDAKIHTVISNSFGFGGTNGSLIFRKVG
jgi:3-oxoacyl-[acyl-carrier-protein] synthase II